MIPSIRTPNLATPANGSLAIPYRFEFGANTSLNLDLTRDVEFNQIAFLQSVFIDNADNTANFDLTFYGSQYPQRIRARPYSQGWYPISWPIGSARILAQSQAGVNVPVIFANYAMPYYMDAPSDGALVVPSLTNVGLQPLVFGAAGEQDLVAAVALQSAALYRGMFEVDNSVTLLWRDGPAGTILFSAVLSPAGSVNFDGSGVAWFATSPGNALVLEASDAVNVYGGFGYVQA